MNNSSDPRSALYEKLISDSKLRHTEDAKNLQNILKKIAESKIAESKPQASNALPINNTQKCFKCIQDKINHRCTELVCNACGNIGHIVRECPWRGKSSATYNADYCQICKVRGHVASNCTGRGYITKLQLKDVRCFICREKGHLRCDV